MSNLVNNGEGTSLSGWAISNGSLNNGFRIVNGYMLQTIVLTPEKTANKYKLSFDAKELRNRKSHITLTVGLSDGRFNTYWFPIQFAGYAEVMFDMNSEAQNITFEVVGDLTISDLRLDTYSELSGEDKLALQKVNSNGEKWDRIIDVTSSTGKLNADMLEGLINTTLNRFANTAGTITQENGETVYLNGTTPENSTSALKISSAGILIADTKNPDGSWHWTTATSGAGISASAIVTGVLSAIEINGVSIIASSMTGGHITGVLMEGNVFKSGDIPNGHYMELNGARISFKRSNINTSILDDGSLWLAGSEGGTMNIKTSDGSGEGAVIRVASPAGKFTISIGNAALTLYQSGDADLDLRGGAGTFNINGNIYANNLG